MVQVRLRRGMVVEVIHALDVNRDGHVSCKELDVSPPKRPRVAAGAGWGSAERRPTQTFPSPADETEHRWGSRGSE